MSSTQDPIRQLGAMIEDVQIAMLTTIDSDGSLRSRPMATQRTKFDGALWFFTRLYGGKAAELEKDHRVNLGYAAPDRQRYVSVSGKAHVLRDSAIMRDLWNPVYRAWFPEGLSDPNLALLKVEVEKAEYWDSPSSTVVHLIGFAKAVLTGKPYAPGRHEHLSLADRMH